MVSFLPNVHIFVVVVSYFLFFLIIILLTSRYRISLFQNGAENQPSGDNLMPNVSP